MSQTYRVTIVDQGEYQVDVEADSSLDAMTLAGNAHRSLEHESTLESRQIVEVHVVRVKEVP